LGPKAQAFRVRKFSNLESFRALKEPYKQAAVSRKIEIIKSFFEVCPKCTKGYKG
jgi:hypothetical protein